MHHKNEVYDFAKELYNRNFHLTILRKNLKNPNYPEWQNIRGIPSFDMTGVGIIVGSEIKDDLYICFIDIDIHRKDRRDKVFHEILSLINKDVYIEVTPSEGYHIAIYAKIKIKKKVFNFYEYNDDAKHKDSVEFIAGGNHQCVIAPSKALNKNGEIGEYRQISDVNIFDSVILEEDELKLLLEGIENLSKECHSQKFIHQHKTTPDHREEIRKVHNRLKTQGFITKPLVNGDKYDSNNADFESENLTGIVLKLGKQSNGKYLNCLDFDDVKDPSEIQEMFCDNYYMEESVSGGYHILFMTDQPLDIDKVNRTLSNAKLEVLWSDNSYVNIAPTCSYIKKYAFSGCPEYNTSKVIFPEIPIVDTEAVRDFILSYKPIGKSDNRGISNSDFRSEVEKEVLEYMYQYDEPKEINRQIKIIFPNAIDLLNMLEIKYINRKYLHFFSLAFDDGENPDAILYFNDDEIKENKWPGYSVRDFHSGELISLGQYLCKYSKDKFDKLMSHMNYNKINIDIPISLKMNKSPLVFECDTYPNQDLILNEINKIISEKQSKILITAPTGLGKTEMFYRLARQKKIHIIMALSYTSQVLQGKRNHSIKGILTGMCENDNKVPESGSIFMTYDKAPIVQSKINPEEYVMIIDEAHNLVNHYKFREKAVSDLKELARKCKAVIYMSATPEYMNYNDIDAVIKIRKKNTYVKNAYVVKYDSDAKSSLSKIIIDQHRDGTIDILYVRSKDKIRKIQKILNNYFETHILFADLKDESVVYNNISNLNRLTGNVIFESGGVLLTTNLIVDGVNILDNNINNLYILDPESTTDLIQFPARFRNGYNDYYIFVSGRKPEYIKFNRLREDLLAINYRLALKHKESHDKISNQIKDILRLIGVKEIGSTISNDKIRLEHINLIERYIFLDKYGEISEESIMMKIQQKEVFKMWYDIDFLKVFMTSYDFCINELDIKNLLQSKIAIQDILKADNELKLEKQDNIVSIKKILPNEELVMDYLKKKHKIFPILSDKFNIKEYIITGKYYDLLSMPECNKMIFRYCIGLEINAVNPMGICDNNYSDVEVDSIKRTYNNLKAEIGDSKFVKDDKYYRFMELRDWIRDLKKGNASVTVDAELLKKFMARFNDKYGKVYNENDTKGVLNDLNDIFEVQKTTILVNQNKVRYYTINNEWNLSNIRGIACN